MPVGESEPWGVQAEDKHLFSTEVKNSSCARETALCTPYHSA